MKPKEQHEHLLANADRELIEGHLRSGAEQGVTRVAVTLARQCDLLAHFRRLWMMRVANLDPRLSTELYMQEVYVNRRELYKDLCGPRPR